MHHTAIPIVSLEKSQSFYERLGFTKVREWKKPDEELSAVVIEKDGFTLELIHHPSHQVIPPSPMVESRHLGIRASELDSLVADLQKEGIVLLKPITQGVTVTAFCFISDPSGNAVELFTVA